MYTKTNTSDLVAAVVLLEERLPEGTGWEIVRVANYAYATEPRGQSWGIMIPSALNGEYSPIFEKIGEGRTFVEAAEAVCRRLEGRMLARREQRAAAL